MADTLGASFVPPLSGCQRADWADFAALILSDGKANSRCSISSGLSDQAKVSSATAASKTGGGRRRRGSWCSESAVALEDAVQHRAAAEVAAAAVLAGAAPLEKDEIGDRQVDVGAPGRQGGDELGRARDAASRAGGGSAGHRSAGSGAPAHEPCDPLPLGVRRLLFHVSVRLRVATSVVDRGRLGERVTNRDRSATVVSGRCR